MKAKTKLILKISKLLGFVVFYPTRLKTFLSFQLISSVSYFLSSLTLSTIYLAGHILKSITDRGKDPMHRWVTKSVPFEQTGGLGMIPSRHPSSHRQASGCRRCSRAEPQPKKSISFMAARSRLTHAGWVAYITLGRSPPEGASGDDVTWWCWWPSLIAGRARPLSQLTVK